MPKTRILDNNRRRPITSVGLSDRGDGAKNACFYLIRNGTLKDRAPEPSRVGRRSIQSTTVNQAEQKLLEAVQRGRTMSSGPPTKIVPDCLIHADCLQWLCTNEDARKLITHRGIRARDVLIDGVLDLDDAQVPFPFRATNCIFNNDIRFERARLRSLALVGCCVKNIQAAGVVIEGEAELNEGFTADGQVNFVAADITGALDFQSATLRNPGGISLYANRARIGGSLYLRRNFRSVGEINITRTTIGSNLDCGGAHLFNPRGQAINASSTEILGNILFRNTYVAGALNIMAARVHGFVACDRARFTHFQREQSAARPVQANSKYEGRALIAKSAKIDGDVSLIRGFRAIGTLEFESADIGGNLECTDAELRAKTGAILDLRQASVTAFWDDRKSWPFAGKLRLDGFTYKRIFEDETSPRPDHPIEWLRLQPTEDFFPHPYEQLFAAAKGMGHEAQARAVMIEKNKAFARYISQRFKSKPGHRFRPFNPSFSTGMVVAQCVRQSDRLRVQTMACIWMERACYHSRRLCFRSWL